MSIYHLEMKNIRRGAGQNSLATLAYITGQPCRDEQLHRTFNYSRRKDRVKSVLVGLPKGMKQTPGQYRQIFQSLEKFETADNARTAKEFIVALPVELTDAERKKILQQFTDKFIRNGYPVVIAIHEDPDGKNPHAHILIPNRPIDPATGEWVRAKTKTKTKTVLARDESGNKIPVIDPATGKQKVRVRPGKGEEKIWKREKVSVQVEQSTGLNLDSKEFLKECRASWADCCNRYLDEDHRIDHRSYKDQGIERVPTIHEGWVARQMERHGQTSDRCEQNRIIHRTNDEIVSIDSTVIDAIRYIQEQTGKLKKQLRDEQEQAGQRNQESKPEGGLHELSLGSAIGRGADRHDRKNSGTEPEPEPPRRRRKKGGHNGNNGL